MAATGEDARSAPHSYSRLLDLWRISDDRGGTGGQQARVDSSPENEKEQS